MGDIRYGRRRPYFPSDGKGRSRKGKQEMPLYEIRCRTCGQAGEVLVTSSKTTLICPACGSEETTKIMSATSSLTGRMAANLPGPADTGCCGSRPGHAGCAGPGSCCGKTVA